VATAGNQSASVAFVAPADTGYPAGAITGYRVTSSPGGFTGTGLTSPVTVTGLTNGTAYTFTVAAQNVNGYGPESVASNSVTPVNPNYIEQVFSTWLYTGNSGSQTVTNNINLSGNGGLVWIKGRNYAGTGQFFQDTVRGANQFLDSTTSGANQDIAAVNTVFSTTGFSQNNNYASFNESGYNYVAWTFREQSKFFDVLTYTGNGTAGRTVSHNLGSTPGFILVKRTDTGGSTGQNWVIWHRSAGGTGYFNSTNALDASFPNSIFWGNGSSYVAPTSTTFTVTDSQNVNASGGSYVAYIFAHNAGGFGLSGADNVISCGSLTSTSGVVTVNLGYEPQWLMMKNATSADSWYMYDTMRGMSMTNDVYLRANQSAAEGSFGASYVKPTATGFTWDSTAFGGAGDNYIYIAIRRGPMAVPTDATTVFSPVLNTGDGTKPLYKSNTVVAPDLFMNKTYNGVGGWQDATRLTGDGLLASNTTAAESAGGSNWTWDFMNGVRNVATTVGSIYWHLMFKRAPSFCDVVCYSGNDAFNRAIPHNLAVVPELVIVKNRNYSPSNWAVYSATTGVGNPMALNTTAAAGANPYVWGTTAPTSTNFYVGDDTRTNGLGSGFTYVMYLFATCPGVSKVGSYTGTGATQTIACGFAAGARFVMIKRTDSTGDWYVWDTVRGMVSGTDPSLLFNTTAAQVNADSVFTITTGFQIVSTAAGINASGGTYIFLAIA
jgi:hypothetical protein